MREVSLIKLAVSLCFLSTAYQYHQFSNSTFSWLFVEFGWSESHSILAVNLEITVLIFSVIAIWIPKLSFLSLLGAAVIGFNTIAHIYHSMADNAFLDVPSNLVRVGAPLSIVCMELFKSQKWGLRLLTWSIASTFMGHGLKALYDTPIYLDYITQFFHVIGVSIIPSTTLMVLHIIGTIDLAVAHHICFFHPFRIRWVFIYMTFWGLITAFSRVLYSGWGAWHEVTLRAPHYIIPLVLLCFIVKKRKERLTN